MGLSTVRRSGAAFACGLLGCLLAPTAAGASGFKTPVPVSGSAEASTAEVAVAPTGRTAVLSRHHVRAGRRFRTEFRAAVGPSPERLGRAVAVPAGWRALNHADAVTLLARPDGGFVACFPDATGRRDTVIGCSVASPTGTFGELKVVERRSDGRAATLAAAMRPDGTTLLLTTRHRADPDGRHLRAFSAIRELSPDGVLGPARPFVRPGSEMAYATSTPLVVLADGTAAIPATVPAATSTADGIDRRHPAVRLMPPGATAFGPPVPVGTDLTTWSVDLVAAGTDLVVRFDSTGPTPDGADGLERVVRRRPDGSVSGALALPGTQSGQGTTVGPVVPLPTGDLLAVTSRTRTSASDSDCFDPIVGRVTAGALEPVGRPGAAAAQLSTRGQIALTPAAAALADGTVIAAWQDAAVDTDRTRVEVAIRPAGSPAFAAPQVLPARLWTGRPVLAAAGEHAALAWLARGNRDTSRVVVSALRAEPPYAAPAPRPRSPSASCDE